MKVFGLAILLAAARAAPNIVELAKSVPDLSTLVEAVVAADLVDSLSSPGTFTVFAPTNKAFAALPYGSLERLLKPENKDVLVDVLKNHVLPEKVLLKDFEKYSIKNIKTLSGDELSLADSGGSLGARACAVSDEGLACHYLKKADNLASNGVVHIIDGVLAPGTIPLPNRLAKGNIVELAKSVKGLSTLVTAVVAGGLVDLLSSPGPSHDSLFTVFAPTDEAFAALPPGTIDSLLKPENKAELVDILKYHVLPQQVDLDSIQNLNAVARNFGITSTVEGKPLRLLSSGGKVMVGPNSQEFKTVIAADNFATNGIVHIIDGVLMPSAVVSNKTFKLTAFSGRFGCSGKKLGSFDTKDGACYPPNGQPSDSRILCEPNGDAYFLSYGSRDGSCTFPPLIPGYLKKGQCYYGVKIDCNPKVPNIVELAESVADLSTLVGALVAADLVGTLSSPSQKFTVFAPTDEAFKALPAGTLDRLMKPENKKELVDILTYHVLPEQVLSTDLKSFQAVTTIEGKPLKVIKFGDLIRVGASLESQDLKNVTRADNLASNGVVHIIDGVLLPPQAAVIV